MKFNQLKPIVLALSLSLVFAGWENNNQKEKPATETEQNESVENTDKVDKEKNEETDQAGDQKEDKDENKEAEVLEKNGSLTV